MTLSFIAGLWEGRVWLRSSPRQLASRLRNHALEAVFEQLTDRLARAELALLQEQHRHHRTLQHAAVVEADLVKLRSLLDQHPGSSATRLDAY
ncbi:hypothetical protein [Teichococcus vastitatis]|uniref:Uncharacterized protein n=1 Tax=Teichococcus vastitatis TaxID=2307076 RepID=A0ABS9W6Z4_9PROT|nr:hypothetical protein [Pseudoroseomonas vastitatis]MCI0754808.1 hypothetical protein [Pseudoroseomonas vastitatis]